MAFLIELVQYSEQHKIKTVCSSTFFRKLGSEHWSETVL